jgi:tripartite-type tricarboxylate transporter receptor subunit TctC
MLKKALIGAAATTAMMVAASTSFAFPDRPVTFVVPFSAGGGTDGVARAFQQEFAKALGGTVIVKNTAGASGTVGAAEAANAKADGYTLGFLPIGPATIQPHIRKLPYSLASWEFVCNVTASPVTFMVKKDAPWNSLADFVAEVKGKPGKYVYGSSGPGTIPHLAMAATAGALGLKMKHMPDKGTANAMKSMAGGVIQAFADTPVVLSRYDVKALATFTAESIPALSDIPTMKSLGNDLQFSVWRGIFAPKGTPADVIAKLDKACAAGAASDGFKAFAKKTNTDILYMDSAKFQAFAQSEYKKNGTILEKAGLKK